MTPNAAVNIRLTLQPEREAVIPSGCVKHSRKPMYKGVVEALEVY